MNYVYYNSRIRTLVAMATYIFQRLIMGKSKIDNFFLSHLGYFEFVFCLLSSPLGFLWFLTKSLNLIGFQGTERVNFRKKKFK